MTEPTGYDAAPIVVTLKGGSGYEAPWVVIRGTAIDEAIGTLEESVNSDFYVVVAASAVALQTEYVKALPAPAPQSAPAASAATDRPPLTGAGQANAQGVVKLNVPFAKKNEAKALGARWDKDQKSWIVKPQFEPDYLTKFAAYL